MPDIQREETQPKQETMPPIPVSAETSVLAKAIESGEPEQIGGQLEERTNVQIKQVEDLLRLVADPDFPQVSEDARNKAEELEKNILERSNQAQKEIAQVRQEAGPETVAVILEEAKQETPVLAEQPALKYADEQVSRKLSEAAESAFAAQDEKGMETAFADIAEDFNNRIANRQKQLTELYAKPVSERTEQDQAKIDELEFAKAIDRKSLDRRQIQLDLIKFKKEKIKIDQEATEIQAELALKQNQQDDSYRSEKQGLENRLAEVLIQQTELSEKIKKHEALAIELADTILQLTRLMDRTRQIGQGAAKAAKEKVEVLSSPESGIGGYDGSMGSGRSGEKQIKQKSGTGLEDAIGGAFTALHDPADFGGKIVDKIIKGATSKKTV